MRITILNLADKFVLKFKRLFYAQVSEVGVMSGTKLTPNRALANARLGTIKVNTQFEDIQEMENAASKNVDHRRRNGGYLFFTGHMT